MRPHSALWDQQVLESGTVVLQADVLLAGQLHEENVGIVSGSVTLDRTAAIRGRLQASFYEPLKVPGSAVDSLSPQGYELSIRQGFAYGRGVQPELVGLGVFPIQTSGLDDELVTTIAGMDRAQTVTDARLEEDYVVAGGALYTDAIRALILAGVPWIEFAFPSIAFTTPAAGLVFPAQEDRWKAAQGMAKSIGCELYFDGDGRCCLLPEPSITAVDTVWTIAEGSNGALERLTIDRDREGVYNRVVAWSNNSGNPTVYRGVATDLNPASPTYYHGPFGRKPRFYVSEFIGSDAQAASAAAGILNANLGLLAGLSLEALPNPALEPGDAVLVDRSDMGVVNEVHLLDIVTIGLGATGTMTAESRARQDEASS